MRRPAAALGGALLVLLAVSGCGSDDEQATPAPPAVAPSVVDPRGVVRSDDALRDTVTMSGEGGRDEVQREVVQTWRRVVEENQIALAKADPEHGPLLELLDGAAEEAVVGALTRNRERGEYLLGEVTEQVRRVAVEGETAKIAVCELSPELTWFALPGGRFVRDADPQPISYDVGLTRDGDRWLVTTLAAGPKGTCVAPPAPSPSA